MSEPITTALRGLLCARPLGDPCWDAMDAVDAVHAALEAENAALRERVGELDNVGSSMHDADGVPIRFGDKATVPWSEKVYEVSGFSCTQQLAGGERTIWVDVYSLEKMGNVPLCGANSCHHYHAPTVEDVMVEFATDWECSEDGEDKTAVLKEYAAKLRLAGSDTE